MRVMMYMVCTTLCRDKAFILKDINHSSTIICTMNPNGHGPTSTINGAELAAILVALQRGHTFRQHYIKKISASQNHEHVSPLTFTSTSGHSGAC